MAVCGLPEPRADHAQVIADLALARHALAADLTGQGEQFADHQPVAVDEPGMISTSFPGFLSLMRGLGGEIEQ